MYAKVYEVKNIKQINNLLEDWNNISKPIKDVKVVPYIKGNLGEYYVITILYTLSGL